MRKKSWTALVLALAACAAWGGHSKKAGIRLRKVFGDHMVLQQGVSFAVGGRAEPGASVTVAMAGHAAAAKADKKGVFAALLPPMAAGGPYEMVAASSSSALTLKDVLVGEVWYASGQSNMEWVLNSSLGAEAEVKRSAVPDLRLFTQKPVLASKPAGEAEGEWVVSGPETAGNFSAVAYFFGKRLQRELKVPVGMVCAAWGGSSCESWTSEKCLFTNPALRPILDRWKKEPASRRKDWVEGAARKLEFTDMVLVPKNGGPPRPIGDGEWSAWAKPGSTASFHWVGKNDGKRKVGVYAGKFQAAAWGGAGTDLNGGKPEDLTSYDAVELKVKGHGVFKMELTQPSVRDYDYPCSDPVTLKKEWKKLRFPIAQFKQAGWGLPKPYTPQELVRVQFQVVMGPLPPLPSAMYNGMVAPWSTFPVKGVLWYQGESNASRAEQYAPLLKGLVGDWRRLWHNPGMPFLVVQLPNYDPKAHGEEAGVWPELRESQAAVLELPGTAVVTTMDVGDERTIHPPNKEPVGNRLAFGALNVAYGKPGALGPLFDGVTLKGRTALVRFKNAPGGLFNKGGMLRGFEVAGPDGRYVPASARIEGSTVVVFNPSVKEVAYVRYAWADCPKADLFNRSGLPAGPFRTDRFPGLTAGRR